MEFRIIEHVPDGCTLCRQHNGPFAFAPGVQFFGVPSAEGPKQIQGPVALCIGTEERPGCAVHIGRLAGMLDAGDTRKLIDKIDELKRDLSVSEAVVGRQTEKLRRLTEADVEVIGQAAAPTG